MTIQLKQVPSLQEAISRSGSSTKGDHKLAKAVMKTMDKLKTEGTSTSGKTSTAKVLSTADILQLANIQAQIGQIGSKSTEAVFELGDKLIEVRSILGVGGLMKWAKQHFRYTPHHISSHVRISELLMPHRSRLINTAVGSTVMIELLKADDMKREEVISRLEKGEKLGVAQVRAIVAGKEDENKGEPLDPADVTGLDGVSKLGAQKTREERQAFKVLATNVWEILGVEAITETDVDVPKVIGRVDSQLAKMGRIVETTICYYSVVDSETTDVEWIGFPEGKFWSDFYEVATGLRDPATWPKTGIKNWLQYDIVPFFKTALGVPLEDTDFAPEDTVSLDDDFFEGTTTIASVPTLAPEDSIFDGPSDEAQVIIEDPMETSVDSLDDIEFIEEDSESEPESDAETLPSM